MTNAGRLISPPAEIPPPPARLFERAVGTAKIKETERERIQSSPSYFCVSPAIRDASACKKNILPVISGESGCRFTLNLFKQVKTHTFKRLHNFSIISKTISIPISMNIFNNF